MPLPLKRLFYFAATQAGDFWPVTRGHLFQLNGEQFVVTGWDTEKRHVFVSRNNQHRVITGAGELWDYCNMQFRTSAEKA